jgi:arginine-tRNA-protein transferase
MDELWAQGWRHFGTHFFKYSVMEHQGTLQTVTPLRVDLSRFALTKSQRRVLRKNADVAFEIGTAQLSGETTELFERHKTRFTDNVPENLGVFLSADPSAIPCRCLQVRCLLDGRCVATSFFDEGEESTSSVYAVFDPAHGSRSLGIFTLLQEIFWARDHGMRFAYPGYATLGASHYDYKKQFVGLQGFEWASQSWLPWAAMSASAGE